MNGLRRRKITLLDAMILVAAAAAGAVSLRPGLYFARDWIAYYREEFPRDAASLYPLVVVRLVNPWLIAFTGAFLLIRLRRERPSIARLMRQSGTAAGLTVAVVVLANGLLAGLDIVAMGIPPMEDFYHSFYPGDFGGAGAAVAAVWGLMALGRRWRAEPEWIDRMGRVLGVCWIVVFLVGTWEGFWLTSLTIRTIPPPPTPAQVAAQKQKEAMREQRRADSEALVGKLAEESKALQQEKERREATKRPTPE